MTSSLVKGLPNIANSCYFNSSIQLCKQITSFNFKDDNDEQNAFVRDIQSLFSSDNNEEEMHKYIGLFKFVSKNLEYQIGVQQDSCEVLQFILDKYVELFSTKDLLESVFSQIVKCINCSNIRICSEQKESMLISHELNNNPNDEINFSEFFSNITSTQYVEGINTECNCNSPKGQVQTIIKYLPPFLFIKVGRCNPDTTKNYKKLKFSERFEIDYPTNLEKVLNNTEESLNKVVRVYKLRGIIVHFGQSSTTGHYVSIIKHDSDNNWYCYDDLSVQKFDLIQNIEQIQRNCCVLLYDSQF